MNRRMLINAIHPEECRVAIVDGTRLIDLEVERTDQGQLKGNIYKASITRIEPSLQAAFLDIGATRNGFLQINDINPSYYHGSYTENGRGRGRPSIQDVLDNGQELVVQVVKDERDLKGATLTTNLSIPGRYLVLMIGSQRGGVSRKINDEGQRRTLRQALQSLRIPAGMGVIVRTAGINKSTSELQADLDSLLEVWQDIVSKSLEQGTPKALYLESDLAIRTIRDYFTGDIGEILVDDKETFERVKQFIARVVPSFEHNVIYYDRPQPLFSTFHLDTQLETIHQPEVTLPSGGSIVINSTEAIVAIDVNSGRATGKSDVEETAFQTNKEAAETIAQQLRLRDLGGLVVIDFIDMSDRRHKQVVERVLKDAVRFDKAKVEIGRISKFGLLEMSRQRLKASLHSQSHATCPHCGGRGRVKTPEAAALDVLRKIESAVFAGGMTAVRVRMSPAGALFLLNSKRTTLTKLEETTGVNIRIYADGRLKSEDYELEIDTSKRDGDVTFSAPSYPPLKQSSDSQMSRRSAAAKEENEEDELEEDRPRRQDRRHEGRHRSGQRYGGQRNRNRNERRGGGRNFSRGSGGDRDRRDDRRGGNRGGRGGGGYYDRRNRYRDRNRDNRRQGGHEDRERSHERNEGEDVQVFVPPHDDDPIGSV